MLAAICTYGQTAPPYKKDVDSAKAYLTRKNRDYTKALRFYEASFAKGNNEPDDYYNAGCCASLVQKQPTAFKYLKRSIQLGYMSQSWMEGDKDLTSLHADPQWPLLLKEFDNQILAIEKLFAGIKTVKPSDLIPYRSAGWWGYMDKRTKKVIVKPAFRSLGFMSTCAIFKYRYEDIELLITSQGKVTKEPIDDQKDVVSYYDEAEEEAKYPKHISSKDGFKGFNMDENGKITTFSDIYTGVSPVFFNISEPFKLNNAYHAIVHKSKRDGIIDQQGNPFPGFNFVHKDLVWNNRVPGSLKWFYMTDTLGKSGFINEDGDKKCYGELLSYPFYSNDRFNLSVQNNKDSSGILDVSTMEWVLKPQPIHITRTEISHNGDCHLSNVEIKDENIIGVYYLVEKGENAYYIDKLGTKYWPK
ncbi:hypothetical protein C7475_101868 [Chitinophaga sp. S165]|nr:hypothetical protein C7475_101868 [Chitinophaga sp. S165]